MIKRKLTESCQILTTKIEQFFDIEHKFLEVFMMKMSFFLAQFFDLWGLLRVLQVLH